jgi:hypothetical protein
MHNKLIASTNSHLKEYKDIIIIEIIMFIIAQRWLKIFNAQLAYSINQFTNWQV